jgi:hypothetical protein
MAVVLGDRSIGRSMSSSKAKLTKSGSVAAHNGRTFLSINSVTGLLVVLLTLYPDWDISARLGLIAVFVVFHLLPPLRRHSSLFCRCFLPILIGAICVEAYVLLNEWPETKDTLKYFRFHDDFRESFYGAISTLYAIVTAMALVKGIEDFDAAKRIVAEEVYRLRSIGEMARYFDASKVAATLGILSVLRRHLIVYGANVAEHRDETIEAENLTILRRCQECIAALQPEDTNDAHSLNVMMQAHGDLGTLRARRISAIGEKMPSYLIVALWVMALGLVLPFMSGPLDEQGNLGDLRYGQYYIIFLMAALNSFLLLMLSDISNPFDGFWQIDLAAFRDLAETMELGVDGTPLRPTA